MKWNMKLKFNDINELVIKNEWNLRYVLIIDSTLGIGRGSHWKMFLKVGVLEKWTRSFKNTCGGVLVKLYPAHM